MLHKRFVKWIIGINIFEGGLFDDAPMGEVPPVDHALQESASVVPPPVDSDDDMDQFGGPPSMGGIR